MLLAQRSSSEFLGLNLATSERDNPFSCRLFSPASFPRKTPIDLREYSAEADDEAKFRL